MTDRPIGPYTYEPAAVHEWDPRLPGAAVTVAALIHSRRPDLRIEHIGSTAVPGLPGKNVVDLGIDADPARVPAITDTLLAIGFERQRNRDPFPATRPLLVGSIDHDGARFRIHCHVMPRSHKAFGRDFARDVVFRDALRADPAMVRQYATLKQAIVATNPIDSQSYARAKTEWVQAQMARLGVADPPILPPATIGILGGGQLGRMIGLAARALGYRVAVLDPDPACPAGAIADEVIVAPYGDVNAALRLEERSAVMTYELEHVAAEVVAAVEERIHVRPGLFQLKVTQDRLAERRFLAELGVPVAAWREVATPAEIRDAANALGFPLRLKAPIGGYDGRSQVRIANRSDLDGALHRLARPAGERLLLERELDFACELSVVCARAVDGHAVAYAPSRNRHDAGILVETVAPAPIDEATAASARALAARLAQEIGIVGTLTVELFLLRDGSLAVNELAPRVHNSGHWTIEGASTSQFEQHVRAITGLPLGSVDPRSGGAATVNLLGTGEDRDARPTGLDATLKMEDVHLHLYDKRRVFERRKMGHVTALAATPDEALERARDAAARISWEG